MVPKQWIRIWIYCTFLVDTDDEKEEEEEDNNDNDNDNNDDSENDNRDGHKWPSSSQKCVAAFSVNHVSFSVRESSTSSTRRSSSAPRPDSLNRSNIFHLKYANRFISKYQGERD